MITVILTASNDAAALARLLAALVPAAADGLVRDVAVIGASGQAAALADEAGAALYPPGAFAQAAAKARGDWICAIPLAAALVDGWMEPVGAHIARAPPTPARLTAAGGLLNRGPEGWLVPKALGPSVAAGEEDFQRLARRGGARLRVLRRGRR